MQKLSVFTANSPGVRLSTVTMQNEVTKLTVTEHIILGPLLEVDMYLRITVCVFAYVGMLMCLCVRGCLPVNLSSGVVSFSYPSPPYLEHGILLIPLPPYLEHSSLKAFLTMLTEALCSPCSPLWSFFPLKPPDFIGLKGLASMLPPKRRLSSSSCLTFVQGPKVTKESEFLVILRALLKMSFPRKLRLVTQPQVGNTALVILKFSSLLFLT